MYVYFSGGVYDRIFLGRPASDAARKGINISQPRLVIRSRRDYSRCGPADSISRRGQSRLLAVRLVGDDTTARIRRRALHAGCPV